ncbi:MAG: DNA translocase FtsK 4TM domain-containing protein [Oscillospiraceae bacterium]
MADNNKKDNKNNSKKKSNNKKKSSQTNQQNQFWAILLFALGVLLLLLTFIKGSDGWAIMHEVYRGVFGVTSFIVPFMVGIVAVLLAQNKPNNTILRVLCECALGLLVISGFFEIFFFSDIQGNTFSAITKYIYNNSIDLKGGGVISLLIGLTLLTIFGKTGARIIMLLCIAVILMFLTNTSLLGIVDLIKKPLIKIKESFSEVNFNFFSGDDDTVPENLGIKKSKKKSYNKKKSQLDEDVSKISLDDILPNDLDDSPNDTKTSLEDKFAHISEVTSKAFEKIKNKIDETFFDYKEIDDEDDEDSEDNIEECPQYKDKPSIDDDNTTNKKLLINNVTNTTDTGDPDIDMLLNSIPSETTFNNDNNIDIEIIEDNNTNNHQDVEEVPIKTKSTPKRKKKYVYKCPSTELLENGLNNSGSKVSKQELETTAKKLIETLESFQAKANIVGISRGPAVTRYEVQPQSGIKVSKITGLADDIALNLATSGVRMEAPIPGKSAIGVEVPNNTKDIVSIRELLESDEFKSKKKKSKLAFVVGKDIGGKVIVGDIAKMPHVIIAGATGSGKSVCTNSIIMSILYNATPDEVKFILIDPKIVEFQHYSGIPHLLIPVVTDPKKATGALNWAVQEMLKRYQTFADNKVKDLTGYNQKVEETGIGEKLPQIVIAIDELADLMMVAKGDVEEAICRLAQMARAAGMHLIIATQRPTVDIITGLIKANIPSRIALSVMSAIDSRTIIDINGAEKLLGQGDMLYFPTGMQKPLRVQGCWVSPKDIENTVDFIKQDFEAEYSNNIMEEIEKAVPVEKGSKSSSSSDDIIPNSDEDLVERAIDLIMENGQASTSMLQRRLKLGYARAGRIMDEICELGIVGPAQGSKPREILITKSQWTERKLNGKNG